MIPALGGASPLLAALISGCNEVPARIDRGPTRSLPHDQISARLRNVFRPPSRRERGGSGVALPPRGGQRL